LQGITENSRSSKRVRRRRHVIRNKEQEIIPSVVVCSDKEAKYMKLLVPIQEEEICIQGGRYIGSGGALCAKHHMHFPNGWKASGTEQCF
jgi:hypothetical protein